MLPEEIRDLMKKELLQLPKLSFEGRKSYIAQFELGKKTRRIIINPSIKLKDDERMLYRAESCCLVSQMKGSRDQGAVDLAITDKRVCLPSALRVPFSRTDYFGRNNLWFGQDVHGQAYDEKAGFFAQVSEMFMNGVIDSNVEIFRLSHEDDGTVQGTDVLEIAYLYRRNSRIPVAAKLYIPNAKDIYADVAKRFPEYAESQ